MSQVEHLLQVRDELGETPIWLSEEHALYWAVWGTSVCRYYPATGKLETIEPGVPVTGLARRGVRGWILIALDGLYRWNFETNDPQLIVHPDPERSDICFNDGAVDRQGRFLVGTFNSDDMDAPDGSLMRLDTDGSLHILASGFALCNGMGVSPDGRTVYLTEMRRNTIHAFDYDPDTGEASGQRDFVVVPDEDGAPDGLVVDAKGYVWSAHWGGWRVTRYDPAGKIDRVYKLPVEQVTSLGFGGDEMTDLYVCSAWYAFDDTKKKERPLAGDIFRIKTDVTGLVEPPFAG